MIVSQSLLYSTVNIFLDIFQIGGPLTGRPAITRLQHILSLFDGLGNILFQVGVSVDL